MYIAYADYTGVYSNELSESEFNRYEYDAERIIDDITQSVDGVKKLQVAMPTVAGDLLAVKRCVCALTHNIAMMDKANIVDTNGIRSGVITSASSGAESISYANTIFTNAMQDEGKRKSYLYSVCKDYLSGVCDSNGVRLLYGGVYVY